MRRIIRKGSPESYARARSTDGTPDLDSYDGPASRIVKYVPSEVIAVYLGFQAIIAQLQQIDVLPTSVTMVMTDHEQPVQFAVLGISFLALWVYLAVNQKARVTQIIFSMIAFFLWLITINAPPFSGIESSVYLGWKNLIIFGVLPGWTLITPIIDGPIAKYVFKENDQGAENL